ncbi:expressed unknown protein [Seminavis robusta]|uniref:Uncharacterized protein n=1 Tax=Seminavis robusta TaxID=568900 RepID=A0A9N8HCE0_9STRA|nr:expressed unknown protein [Seminavis robusta]|eukprot:Sro298_g111120.1 n/a (310) ;mRNA; f:42460-43389
MIAYIVNSLCRQKWDRMAYENGTPFTFNSEYMARRFVGLQNEETTAYIAKHLSSMCQETLGCVLDYPVMKGQSVENKAIVMLYSKTDEGANFDENEPAAFNVAFSWELSDGTPCIHYGLFIVTPSHQRKGIQGPLGFLNLYMLLRNIEASTVWMTDLGRSPSGSRHFINFMSEVYPRPPSSKAEEKAALSDDEESQYEAQLRVAREFHARFQKDAGMSANSVLDGMVIKGSNLEGGATALVDVNGSTRSRSKAYNDWIDKLCPSPADELLMVGQFLPGQFVYRQVFQKNFPWLVPSATTTSDSKEQASS